MTKKIKKLICCISCGKFYDPENIIEHNKIFDKMKNEKNNIPINCLNCNKDLRWNTRETIVNEQFIDVIDKNINGEKIWMSPCEWNAYENLLNIFKKTGTIEKIVFNMINNSKNDINPIMSDRTLILFGGNSFLKITDILNNQLEIINL